LNLLYFFLRGEIRHKLEVLKMKFSGTVLARQSVGEHFKYIIRAVRNKQLVRTAYILSLRVVNVHAVGTVLFEQAVTNKILLGKRFRKHEDRGDAMMA
jgi:hypothetical protein